MYEQNINPPEVSEKSCREYKDKYNTTYNEAMERLQDDSIAIFECWINDEVAEAQLKALYNAVELSSERDVIVFAKSIHATIKRHLENMADKEAK